MSSLIPADGTNPWSAAFKALWEVSHNDDGTEKTASAPANAHYLTTQAEAGLSNETLITAVALDTLAAPTDNTGLNASTSAHGLLPKGDGNTSHFLNGALGWATPAGGSSPFTNLKTEGAVGDGTTDDTAAWTAALTAVAAGGTIYAPTGVYKLVASAQFDLPSNVTVMGDGPGSVLLISASGANGSLRFPSGNSGCVLQNVTVRRGNTTATRLLDVHAGNSTVRSVVFDPNGNAGTAVTAGSGADGLAVTGCLFKAVNGSGFLANGVNGLQILGNRWQGHLGTSPPLSLNTNCSRYQISDNAIISDATATAPSILVVTASSGTTMSHGVISGNYIESVEEGINVQKTTGGNQPYACSITGNTLKTLAAAGAGVTGISVIMDRGTVSGNTIDCNGVTGVASGIELSASNYCAVTGNQIYGASGVINPIILNGSSYNTVTGNMVYGLKDATSASSAAIYLYATSTQTTTNGNTVVGNVVFFSAASGTVEHGIVLESSDSTAHVDRNVIVGNSVYGNDVTGSQGIKLTTDSLGGSVDRNLIGMNIVLNCAAEISQSGDTNTLLSGSTWNLVA